MFRNPYEMEIEIKEKILSMRAEAQQERLARQALRAQPGGFSRRALSGLGEKLIVVGLELHRRYSDCRSEHQTLLEHVLSVERVVSTTARTG